MVPHKILLYKAMSELMRAACERPDRMQRDIHCARKSVCLRADSEKWTRSRAPVGGCCQSGDELLGLRREYHRRRSIARDVHHLRGRKPRMRNTFETLPWRPALHHSENAARHQDFNNIVAMS